MHQRRNNSKQQKKQNKWREQKEKQKTKKLCQDNTDDTRWMLNNTHHTNTLAYDEEDTNLQKLQIAGAIASQANSAQMSREARK